MFDSDIVRIAKEMAKAPQIELDFQPAPLVTMIEEQNELLKKQNEQLESSNKDLSQLLDIKERELQEAKKDATKAKSYNAWMMVIAIISMFVAIASWAFPIGG